MKMGSKYKEKFLGETKKIILGDKFINLHSFKVNFKTIGGTFVPPAIHVLPPCAYTLRVSINFRVKYVFVPCGLKILFFSLFGSFRIVDGISFLAKDRDDTSVQLLVKKLTEVYVNISKKLTHVLCLNI
jgi:hypothetical protein